MRLEPKTFGCTGVFIAPPKPTPAQGGDPLLREESGAWFNQADALAVTPDLIEKLRARALDAPLRRFRLCLHASPSEGLQDMLIVHARGSYSPPHRHPQASVTFQVVDGEMGFVRFDARGRVLGRWRLAAGHATKPCMLRLQAGIWYMPWCLSSTAVFRETLHGSNVGGRASEYASWSPREGNPEDVQQLISFLGWA
ncbi:MAG: WbuC family cupin fold metalloprotein [Lentisphaerae bacterium]|nr:WbuC family cupin fold metalloprotein [Lentisphaerota bacterium]